MSRTKNTSISKTESSYNVKPLSYVKTNILKDFQICISAQCTFKLKSAIINYNNDKL